jgi:uncharacterized protein
VWAPFHTLHKILAGLLDMHEHCGDAQALEIALGLVAWIRRWAEPLGDDAMARILEVEYGGMNEVLYDLYAITADRAHADLAHRFDQPRVFDPLAEGRDELKGLHANTQLAKLLGAARRYELFGEERYRGSSSSSGGRSPSSGRTARAARATASAGVRGPASSPAS